MEDIQARRTALQALSIARAKGGMENTAGWLMDIRDRWTWLNDGNG